MIRKFFFCLIMSCLPVLTIAAQTVSDSIPFELGADNRIYLRCRVNDSDTAATMTCFLDAHLMKTRWSSHSPEMVISEKHVASKMSVNDVNDSFIITKQGSPLFLFFIFFEPQIVLSTIRLI